MKIHYLFGLIAAALLLAIACNPEKEAMRKIDKPLPDVSLGEEKFIIDTSKDTLIEISSGSSIFIPANSIVDADNNPVPEAEIQYEEYTDAAAILLSGIPMVYDSAGEEQIFQSAGMFWVNATKTTGEQLFIAEGKNININMVSEVSDEDGSFNFYKFDTTEGNWNYLASNKAEIYLPEVTKEESTKSNIKAQEQKASNVDFIFEMEFTDEYADIEEFSNIFWKFSGNTQYEDPEKEMWIFSTKWTTSNLEEDPDNEGEYILELYNNVTSQGFTTSIIPINEGGMSNNSFNKQMEELDEGIEKITKINQTARINQRFVRTMALSGFGFHNWDFIHRFRKTIKQPLAFMENGSKINEPTRIYQLFINLNAMVEYGNESNNSVLLTPDDDYIFIALNPDGTVLLYNDTYDLYNEAMNGRRSIELFNTGETVKTKEDLMAIIG